MATIQALPLTRDPSNSISAIYAASSLASADCIMGSVGSLMEKHDAAPIKANKAVPQVPQRQNRKGFSQRELLNYLNISRKEPKGGKHIVFGNSSIKREHSREEENLYAKVYHKDGKELDLGKNSLPIGGKFDKPRLRSSAFKPVTPKNFSSVQNIYPSKSDELANGKHSFYSKTTSKSLSTSSSSSSPSRVGTSANKGVLVVPHEDTASDSGHNSMSSLPPYRPPFRPHLGQISASMGHIEHIGSLERTSAETVSVRARSTAPESNELSHSLEDMVKDLEDRLQDKELELWQMQRNLDESEDAIAQVFEGKQRLWEKEVSELKQLYTTKLRQVSQQSQRSQRALQLQLYKAQHERNRLQDELNTLRHKYQILPKQSGAGPSQERHEIEETQWEVCQKAGEISLLKQQLKDSQAEVTQKLSEIFHLKTQLRETRHELNTKEGQLDMTQLALQAARRKRSLGKSVQNLSPPQTSADDDDDAPSGATEERLRAELLFERRQNEAQASAFEVERSTWQLEKEKVLRYQRELQASYLEMFHKNESLERELQQFRGGGAGAVVGVAPAEPSGLPWIERIESSEI